MSPTLICECLVGKIDYYIPSQQSIVHFSFLTEQSAVLPPVTIISKISLFGYIE